MKYRRIFTYKFCKLHSHWPLQVFINHYATWTLNAYFDVRRVCIHALAPDLRRPPFTLWCRRSENISCTCLFSEHNCSINIYFLITNSMWLLMNPEHKQIMIFLIILIKFNDVTYIFRLVIQCSYTVLSRIHSFSFNKLSVCACAVCSYWRVKYIF